MPPEQPLQQAIMRIAEALEISPTRVEIQYNHFTSEAGESFWAWSIKVVMPEPDKRKRDHATSVTHESLDACVEHAIKRCSLVVR